MAPSRRKSKASSAAAVAAACRQWKVGDLVLAKVKGFPAWPATVSEPEKWGYSADWKKVLVYFFGTKQIAFCNPADVEAFTEEKKESLLGKRQGKGADFVRAVKEIIECYEKSKKQDRLDDFNADDEVIRTNAGNSADSLPCSRLRNQSETSSVPSQLNSYGTKNIDKVSPLEDAVTNASQDRDTLSEEPTENVVIAETSFATTYSSRKRSVGIEPHSKLKQKRALRSRSSSRSHILMVPSNDVCKSVGDIASNVLRDGSLRRNKQIRRPPDASEMHGAGSPAFVSNGSIEDDGSEIVTVDSDTLSFNEGSTLEFGSNLEHIETIECLEGEMELGKRPDFQINAVVTKKKRKLSRKRVNSDAPELTDVLDKVAAGETEMHKSKQNLPNICEKLDGRFSKEDGDEHLPFVKRARVRMGKQSAFGEKLDSFIKMENSSKEVPCSGVYSSLNCAGDNSANRNSVMVKEDVVNTSPSNICFQFSDNRPQGFENRKNQAFGSLDGEAALPPSKRLHRALEAMSANVAEDGVACTETPFTNGCCVSPIRKYQHKSKERKDESDFRVHVVSHGHNASENHTSQISEENKRSSVDAENWTQPVMSSKSSKDEFENAEGAVQALSTDHFSADLDGRPASLRIDQDSLDQLSPKNEEKCENMGSSHDRAEIPVKEANTSESTGISTDPIAEADIITKLSPQNGTIVQPSSKGGTFCDNTKSLKIPPDDSSQVDDMCEIAREINNKSFQNTEKVSPAIWETKQSQSASISDDNMGEKDVTGIQSRPSPADGTFFPARDSPSHTSLSHITKTGSNNFLQNNSRCSLEVQLHEHDKKTVYTLDVDEEKSDSAVTSVGKSNHADAGAWLTSFETMLGALTRTKESIGRATRIAIDCVKYGTTTKSLWLEIGMPRSESGSVCAEHDLMIICSRGKLILVISEQVVDILVRHLEKEPSLHKRVDLFFLVDSITQCSRGLKGDVRGIFPSAIQSVLPRLLSAAAPPGNTARENRRQCLKVLRLWLERRILPESIVRHHMRHLDSLSCSSSTGAFSRRPLRNERAFDDPLREMEGMLVDEYGSNSSFQLPGFCMPRMLMVEDDGSDSDGGSFEAVTPEHNSETPEEQELTPTVRKHRHILEDVDGELEMEDVAPSSEAVTSNANEVYTAHTSNHEQHTPSLAPPLPDDVPPSSPPLPTSPPPPPPPLPPPLPPPAVPGTYTNGVDIELYVDTNNMHDNLQAMSQQEVALRTNPIISDALNYRAPERQNLLMETRLPDSTATCSGNVPVSHVPMGPMNNVPQTDGEVLHNKAYHLPPPPLPPTPSSQFSYAHADRQVQSWRDAPFPHYNRYHFPPNMDGGNVYTDHDRLIPHEFNERWRFSGPFYPHDRPGVPSAHVPYIQGEPSRIRNQGWAYPSEEMNYRSSMPIRPSCEATRYWRPR